MEGLKAKRATGTEKGKGIGKGDIRKETNAKKTPQNPNQKKPKTHKLPT